jgi:spore coat protein YutH
MQNNLKYYYNIEINSFINQKNHHYYFKYNNDYYILCFYDRNLNEIQDLYRLTLYISQQNYYFGNIILNKDNHIVTMIDGYPYVLIRNHIVNDRQINLLDIKNYSIVVNNFRSNQTNRFNWADLWSKKIDYYEYQIDHIKNKYPKIIDSIYYYLGMAENAISYIKDTIKPNIKYDLYIAHQRIRENDTISDMYNPLNMVIDHVTRDISEMLKMFFFSGQYDYEQIDTYLNGLNMTDDDARLLYGRLLYPSLYFDLYEEVINNNLDEKKFLKIIDRVEEYEVFLYRIFLILTKKHQLPDVIWLSRKFNH